ncbi:hypothetical protein MNBD_ACTINO02-2930 [hydrothermal vent metagenome]|uniref:Uncharacterized protein n=1 Tax=hydrothermal vent metagenome TaxID=652676 RepID=A0A3B0S3F7_9ZZZZ
MTDPLFAYIDPGAGATLAQLALAGTAGLAAIGKVRLNRIKSRLTGKVDVDSESEPDVPSDESAATE